MPVVSNILINLMNFKIFAFGKVHKYNFPPARRAGGFLLVQNNFGPIFYGI